MVCGLLFHRLFHLLFVFSLFTLFLFLYSFLTLPLLFLQRAGAAPTSRAKSQRRQAPALARARWISLEPGWRVLDLYEGNQYGITVEHDGVRVQQLSSRERLDVAACIDREPRRAAADGVEDVRLRQVPVVPLDLLGVGVT